MVQLENGPEMYDRHRYNLVLDNGGEFLLQWKSQVEQYYTCGMNASQVECLRLVPHTVILYELLASGKQRISIDEFNKRYPNEPLDITCNCHGLTFAACRYFISNRQIDRILDDEFFEITLGRQILNREYDIVCFKNPGTGEWIHSCRQNLGFFIHKEGLRPIKIYSSIDEILQIPEYKGSVPHFYQRRELLCHGICRAQKIR